MASKISKTMAQQLVKALGNPSYEVVGARTNTERAMRDRGLIFHGRLREVVKDARGHQVRTHGMMLTDEGVKEAQRLAAEAAEERGEEPQEAEVTREDVARGVDDALQWLPYGDRDAARARGAVRVLTVEFSRARRVMRKLLGGNRYEVEAQAVAYYGRVRALLAAAKRFEEEDARPAVEVDVNAPGQQYGGITREDVAKGNGPAEALWRAAEYFKMWDARQAGGERPAAVDVMRAEAESVSAVSAAFVARVRGEERPQEPDMAAMSEEEHAAAFGERFAQVRRARVEGARVLGLEVSVRVVSYRAESCAFVGEEDHECESECTWLEGDSRELEDRGTDRFEADSDDLEAFEGDAVAWAADYIRTKTDAVHPSSSPVGEELGEHEWLSGSSEDPYQGDARVTETTVRLVGDWTPQERARVFRAVMA